MPVSVNSYPGRALARNRTGPIRAASLAALAVLMGACTGAGLPFGDFERSGTQAAQDATHPTKASLTVDEAVAPSDWEALRRAIAKIPVEKSGSFEWNNAQTGSNGVIAILAAGSAWGAAGCRAFATTINDIRGIRRYRGQACRATDGRWQLADMSPDDAQLL